MIKTAIHPRYGLKLEGIDLAQVSAEIGYPQIRPAFEQHSLLYFPNQELNDAAHLKLGALFGPREDRSLSPDKPLPQVSMVSNRKQGDSLYKKGDSRLLDLQANMLWHTDSTFLPIPALANILLARVIPCSGTSSEFVSTRAAWEDMPAELKDKARDRYLIHDYAFSRRKIDPKLAEQHKFTHWGQQIWKSIWTNPENGKEALYIASHACAVVGMGQVEGLKLIDELINWCTQEQYIYKHHWKDGDVLIWDERAMLHRGVPWNYEQERSLSSICISATTKDGLEEMRYPHR